MTGFVIKFLTAENSKNLWYFMKFTIFQIFEISVIIVLTDDDES